MRENVGHIDRIVRTILGSGLVAAGLHQIRVRPVLGAGGAIAGAFLLESALTRVCPLNSAFGFDTRSTNERMRDFRADVNEQSDRIASEYSKPIEIAEAAPVA